MAPVDVRAKWNQRYSEQAPGEGPPEPNPLALHFRERVRGGLLLDAACGRGAGIAALIDRVDRAIGVDLSEAALAAARRQWGAHPRIAWIQADVTRLEWPRAAFTAVCAFGFTDWKFLRGAAGLLRPGGLFFYRGFSRRQLTVKPTLDPNWTSTPASISVLFDRWQVHLCEESAEAPFRVSFVAERLVAGEGAPCSG